jgi:hypothetical protein
MFEASYFLFLKKINEKKISLQIFTCLKNKKKYVDFIDNYIEKLRIIC